MRARVRARERIENKFTLRNKQKKDSHAPIVTAQKHTTPRLQSKHTETAQKCCDSEKSQTFQRKSQTFQRRSQTFQRKSQTFRRKSRTFQRKSQTFRRKSQTFWMKGRAFQRELGMVREMAAQRKRKTEKQGKCPPPKNGKPQRHTSQEVEKIEQRWLIHNKRQQRRAERTVFKSMKLKSENKLVYLQADKCTLEKTLIAKVEKVVPQ